MRLLNLTRFQENKKKVCHLINKKEIFCNLDAEETGETEKLHNSANFQNVLITLRFPLKT